MAKKQALIAEKIQIVKFNLVKGDIECPLQVGEETISGHAFNIGYQVAFNLEQKYVKTDFQIEVQTISGTEEKEVTKKDGEHAYAFYHFAFLLQVDNLEELASQKENGEMVVDGALGNAIASIVYSTSRGVLMSRFQGTVFQNFILPVINPNEIMNKQGLIRNPEDHG